MRLAAAAAVLAMFMALPADADEGMWTFNHFPSDKVEATYGYRPDQAWLDRLRLTTLRIPGQCSASIVSPRGLVLTNRHCIKSCLESLAKSKPDIVEAGFYAAALADEPACPGLTLDRTLAITDVTDGVSKAEGPAERTRIAKDCAGGEADIRCEVVELHGGGVFDLYRNRVYSDVRLVFVPERAISDFGGDIDDFHFPRTSLDVAFLRLYADGKPLDTSASYLRQAKDDVKEGDLTFATGSPGFTFRLDTLARLEFRRDVDLPRTIFDDLELRGQLAAFAARGPEQAALAAPRLATLASTLKYNRGRYAALTGTDVIRLRDEFEQALRDEVAADLRLREQYVNRWDEVRASLDKLRTLRDRYEYTAGRHGLRSGLLDLAMKLVRDPKALAKQASRPQPEGQSQPQERPQPAAAGVPAQSAATAVSVELQKVDLAFALTRLREALGPDDILVRNILGRRSPVERAAELVDGTELGDPEHVRRLAEAAPVSTQTSTDPMIALAREISWDLSELAKTSAELEARIKLNLRDIARAAYEVYGFSIAPDASFTARISYGAVTGIRTGLHGYPITSMAELFARAADAEPYRLPAQWLDAQALLDAKRPLNFLTTNDVIGGNSGSPVVNRDGELVGVLFDINYPALGGYFAYDPAVNRAIAVGAGAMRDALAKVYRADRLLAELAE